MRTEAKKSFTHGFLLTEAEVRRLANEIQDQLAKTGAHPIVSSFELNFVTEQSHIHLASMMCCARITLAPLLLRVFACHSSRTTLANHPASFRSNFAIHGANLAKASVTLFPRMTVIGHLSVTSRIEDRIATSRRRFDFGPIMLAVVAAMVLGVLFWTFYLKLPIGDQEIARLYEDLRLAELAKLREEWRSGRLNDPVDAVLQGLEVLVRPKNSN